MSAFVAFLQDEPIVDFRATGYVSGDSDACGWHGKQCGSWVIAPVGTGVPLYAT
jgi:hypothetical protein